MQFEYIREVEKCSVYIKYRWGGTKFKVTLQKYRDKGKAKYLCRSKIQHCDKTHLKTCHFNDKTGDKKINFKLLRGISFIAKISA